VIRLRTGPSFWLRQHGGRAPVFAPLRGHHDADVAIVGGGITGVACAYQLAERGARVVLLEARHIGRGSTAASTALLMQEPDVDFTDLADRYGTAAAREIWRVSRRSVRALVDTLRRLQIPASLHTLPSVYFARAPAEARALRHELTVRRRSGIPGRWLSSSVLKDLTGIDAAAAILTQGNAQVDPYRACLGLAHAAQRSGARLHAHSHVEQLHASSTGVEVELARGRVRASHVIIATGYATPAFLPLAGRFRMLNTYVIATPRLSRDVSREVGLGDVMLWDTERPYHYARWTPDGRLLFGGRDRPAKKGPARLAALRSEATALSADLVDLYPALREQAPEYIWEGLFATTPDGLPYIGPHRRYPRHLFALGYGGNGMTFGFMAAQILVRRLNGKPTKMDELFGFTRRV